MSEYLSYEEIAAHCEHLDGKKAIECINKLFRAQDDSDLWPICGSFSATERAIRRVRDQRRYGAAIDDGLEYASAISCAIGEIVNSEI